MITDDEERSERGLRDGTGEYILFSCLYGDGNDDGDCDEAVGNRGLGLKVSLGGLDPFTSDLQMHSHIERK